MQIYNLNDIFIGMQRTVHEMKRVWLKKKSNSVLDPIAKMK